MTAAEGAEEAETAGAVAETAVAVADSVHRQGPVAAGAAVADPAGEGVAAAAVAETAVAVTAAVGAAAVGVVATEAAATAVVAVDAATAAGGSQAAHRCTEWRCRRPVKSIPAFGLARQPSRNRSA